jgi:hypothetical protein
MEIHRKLKAHSTTGRDLRRWNRSIASARMDNGVCDNRFWIVRAGRDLRFVKD